MNRKNWLNVGAIVGLVIASAIAQPTEDEEQECADADYDYKYVHLGDDTAYYFCASNTLVVVQCAQGEYVVQANGDLNCVSSPSSLSEEPLTPPDSSESSQSTPPTPTSEPSSTTPCGSSSSSSTESTTVSTSRECTRTLAPATAIVPFFNCLDKPDGFRYKSHNSDKVYYVCRHLIEIHECADGFYVNQDFQCVPLPTIECQTTSTSTTTTTSTPTITVEECTCTGTTCYCNTAVCNSTDCDWIDPEMYNI